MARHRIGVSAGFDRPDGARTFPGYDLAALEADGEVFRLPKTPVLGPDALAATDVVILLGECIAADSFADDDRLAAVVRVGVGYDTIDVPACTARDVALTIAPGGVRRPVGVAILTLLLALAGRLLVKDRIARAGAPGWGERIDHQGIGLVGRSLGSLGVGNIGAEMFRLAKPLDMVFIAHDPYVEPAVFRDLGVESVTLPELFRRADFLALNCPLTEETRHIAGRDAISLMKPTAFLINTSRGPVVDQAALYEALLEKRIAGAGLDVFDPEPPLPDALILGLDSVVVTPHALAWTDQMFARIGDINVAAVRAVLAGRVPDNVVNREVVERPGFEAKLARLAAPR